MGRVALFVEQQSSPHTGIGRYAHVLHAGLRDAGIDVVSFAPSAPQLPQFSYRLFRLLGRNLHAFLKNYSALWPSYPEADVYHLASQTLAAALLTRRPKGRVLVTVHDVFPFMLRKDPRLRSPYATDRFYYRLAMAGLKHADLVIANSRSTKQCLVDHVGLKPEKIVVVYPGIDHERFRPLGTTGDTHARHGLPAGRRYLIYVGTEDPRKNLHTLIRALAIVRRDVPDVELIKVGRSHFELEREALIELATELGVRKATYFLDDVPEEDLPLLYNLAELYVTPSLYEGFGFPVLEAMACGTPVVCASAGSLPEVVGNAGVQVSPCDVPTLAGSLVALLSDRERRAALAESGRARAAAFTWPRAVRETTAVYEGDVR